MSKKRESLIAPEDRIVTEALKYEVLCGICCDILQHPRQCLSGHVYCGNCIATCIIKGIPCPSCRRTLTEESVARNLFLEEYCKEIPVYCQYHYHYPDENDSIIPDAGGCPEKISYSKLEDHEKNCRYSWIRCPFTYKTDEHKVRKLNWKDHKLVCEFRPSICKYCDACQPFCALEVKKIIFFFFQLILTKVIVGT